MCRSSNLQILWASALLKIMLHRHFWASTITAQQTTHSHSLLTPPTQTRQNCLVLSVWAVWTQLATRQDSCVLSQPSFQSATVQSQIEDYWKLGRDETKLIESGSRQNKTVLSCMQLCSHRRKRQDKTLLSCPCRQCEQAISIHLHDNTSELDYILLTTNTDVFEHSNPTTKHVCTNKILAMTTAPPSQSSFSLGLLSGKPVSW